MACRRSACDLGDAVDRAVEVPAEVLRLHGGLDGLVV